MDLVLVCLAVNLVKSPSLHITLLFIEITVIIIPADDEYLYMNVILLDYFDVLVLYLCHATPRSAADGLWVSIGIVRKFIHCFGGCATALRSSNTRSRWAQWHQLDLKIISVLFFNDFLLIFPFILPLNFLTLFP